MFIWVCFWLLLHFNLTMQCNITCALLLRITVIMSKAPAAVPKRAHNAPHPSRARRIKVNYSNSKRAQLHCAMTSSIITTKYSCTGLVPESPTFFNSSPFKVLSPQPAKFLKSLLPVKEETKAKKLLEARPLLGQEVRSKELKSLFLKKVLVFLLRRCLSQWSPIFDFSFLFQTPPVHLS